MTSRVSSRTVRALLVASVTGAIAVLIGSFLSWGEARVPILGALDIGGTDSGYHGDSIRGVAVAAALIGTTAPWGGRYLFLRALFVTALGAAVLVLAMDDVQSLRDTRRSVEGSPIGHLVQTSVGPGLLMSLGGGTLTLLCAMLAAVLQFLAARVPSRVKRRGLS